VIKALVVLGDEQVAVIGLSGENMARLMADEPILLNLAEIGLTPQLVLVVGGKDEAAIAEELRKRTRPANPESAD
jgi:hypothetical protein